MSRIVRSVIVGALLLLNIVEDVEARRATVDVEVRAWGCMAPDVVHRIRLRQAPEGGWHRRGHVVSDATLSRLRAALLVQPISLDEWQSSVTPNPASVRAHAELLAAYFQDVESVPASDAQKWAAHLASTWAAGAHVGHLGGESTGEGPCAWRRLSFSTSGSSVRILLPGDPPLEAWASQGGALYLPWHVREPGGESETWSLAIVSAVREVMLEAGMSLRGLDVGLALQSVPPFPSDWQGIAHRYAECMKGLAR